MVKLLDALPAIVDKLDADILPVLDTLATVAPDLRDLLDVSKELNELIGSVPGLGRVKKKIEEKQDSQDEYRAQEEPAAAPDRRTARGSERRTRHTSPAVHHGPAAAFRVVAGGNEQGIGGLDRQRLEDFARQHTGQHQHELAVAGGPQLGRDRRRIAGVGEAPGLLWLVRHQPPAPGIRRRRPRGSPDRRRCRTWHGRGRDWPARCSRRRRRAP